MDNDRSTFLPAVLPPQAATHIACTYFLVFTIIIIIIAVIMPSPSPPSSSQPAPKRRPPRPTTSGAPEPVIHARKFDPWNSSSTGHQRAENRLGASTGWRDSRNAKLMGQFRGGASGGRDHVSDTVGAGSADWDPRAGALITPEARARARHSVADMLPRPGTMRKKAPSPPPPPPSPPAPAPGSAPTRPAADDEGAARDSDTDASVAETKPTAPRKAQDQQQQQQKQPQESAAAQKDRPQRIFDGVVVYVNGSTAPQISDHKLKQVLAEHGARLSVHLGRRQVTHVILGRPAGRGDGIGAGAGGGLAGGKLQREVVRRAGGGSAAVKFVGVEWVLESVRAGRRLPEARFHNLKVVAKGQQSVLGMYSKAKASASASAEARSSGEEPPPPPSGQA